MCVTMLLTAAPVFGVSLRQDPRSRNYSGEPILVDHRDTMNTEKTKHSLADLGSLMGDFSEPTPPPFFSVFIVPLWSTRRFSLHRHG